MIKTVLIFTLSSIVFYSCSQVNRESRDYYKGKKSSSYSMNNEKFRHGLVPIPYTETKATPSQKELDKKSVMRGEKLYQVHCYSCHGVNADGNGPKSNSLEVTPKSLVAIAKKVPNFKLYMMVSQWKGDMPGWKSMLNEKETIDLKNYILSLVQKSN